MSQAGLDELKCWAGAVVSVVSARPAASDLKIDIDSWSFSSQLELNSWGVLYVHCGTFSKNPLITEASEVIFLGSGEVCVSFCL